MSPLIIIGLAVIFVYVFFRMLRLVPEQKNFIIEEWGKFKKVLGPGLHFVIPVIQRVAYQQDLKEEVLDVPPQECITQDNAQVTVDGVLYFKVVDPVKASYGIDNYRFATVQLAQTTMRSEVGKIELERAFSEREEINNAVVKSIDQASDPWGIKVTRYEIRDIEPTPKTIDAMEQEVEAERRKRAEILESEGTKEARVNSSKGEREEAINISMGEKQKKINEAEGMAQSMEIIAEATADGIKMIAEVIRMPKGRSALSLQVANQYIKELGNILEHAEVSVLPIEAAQLQALAHAIMPPGAQSQMGSTKLEGAMASAGIPRAEDVARGLIAGLAAQKGGK